MRLSRLMRSGETVFSFFRSAGDWFIPFWQASKYENTKMRKYDMCAVLCCAANEGRSFESATTKTFCGATAEHISSICIWVRCIIIVKIGGRHRCTISRFRKLWQSLTACVAKIIFFSLQQALHWARQSRADVSDNNLYDEEMNSAYYSTDLTPPPRQKNTWGGFSNVTARNTPNISESGLLKWHHCVRSSMDKYF